MEKTNQDSHDKLYGDDDGGVYFRDENGDVWYLHGYPKLIEAIISLCEKFFRKLS